MFSHNEPYQNNKADQKINALAIQLEQLDRAVDELFSLIELTPEQLTAFVKKPEHFTKENWEELDKQRLALEERLNRSLTNIRNPRKAKRTLSTLNVANNWLYVK
jgi:hypothetical protein